MAKRQIRRTIAGLRVISQGSGHWATEDGRFEIRLGYDGVTYCDEAHPMKLTAGLIADIKERPHLYPPEASWAVRIGKHGYLCPGSEEHILPDAWQVWDTVKDDYLDNEPHYDSFADAVESLSCWLTKQ